MDVEEFASCTSSQLRELYSQNPELFDRLAADAIRHACMGKTPAQTLKLRQMQWAIDARVRKGKTPRDKMHIMENIFYGQVYGSDGHLSRLLSAWDDLAETLTGGDRTARRPELRLLKKET